MIASCELYSEHPLGKAIVSSFKETYNKENEEYEIDFKKALKNEKLKKDFEKLKIWDYLYDVYLEIKKTIEKLDKNIETDTFCTSKKYIEDKYFS